MRGVVAALALCAGCWDPTDDGGIPPGEQCDAVLINYPTTERFWTERSAGIVIGGNVTHSSCDDAEQMYRVTVSNQATGFEETQIAEFECVQIFPTTGATQRNYFYSEFVPLARGQNRIEVRAPAVSKCSALTVTCDPCVDPDASPPPLDAGAADASPLDGGL